MDSNVILLVFMAIMVAMMFLSSRKRKQQAQQLQDSLKVGSRVVLHSGVIGTVKSVSGETIVIDSAGSSLEVLRPAVRSIDPVLASDAPAPVAKPAAKKPATASAKTTAAKPAAKTATAKKPAAK